MTVKESDFDTVKFMAVQEIQITEGSSVARIDIWLVEFERIFKDKLSCMSRDPENFNECMRVRDTPDSVWDSAPSKKAKVSFTLIKGHDKLHQSV